MKELDEIEAALEIAIGYPALVAGGVGNMPISRGRASSDAVISQALTALQTLRDKVGWQPIETAPRDGDWIIVVSGKNIIGDSDTPYLARWAQEWSSFRNGLNNDTKPTHWMPLPTPPESEG